MKAIKIVEAKLNSEKDADIFEAITLIQDNALFSYLPNLAFLHSKYFDKEFAQNIETLFNDMRHKEAIPFILPLLSDSKLSEKTQLMLISSCWQSGMDYSNDILKFVPFLSHNEFIFAFEAFTVIESNIDFISDKQKVELREELLKVSKNASENISDLCEDLIEML